MISIKMYRISTFIGLALTMASYSLAQGASRFSTEEIKQGYSNRHIIAKPRANATSSVLTGVEMAHRFRSAKRFSRLGNLAVFELPADQTPASAIAKLRASGLYEYVEFDSLKTRYALSNDPRVTNGEAWHLNNTGQNGGTAGADISASTAWSIRTSAPGVIVAVIDTGIRATHEDLSANLWVNPGEVAGNNIDDDNNGYVDDIHGINVTAPVGTAAQGKPDDDHGHGTAVSSCIAAVGNNAKGTSGVAWDAKIMALKFDNIEDAATLSGELACIDYAIAKGAHIINFSYGGKTRSAAEEEAYARARAAGIIIVAAAGNDGANNDQVLAYPTNLMADNLVSVAASDRTDYIASFSSYGPGLVDLAAPGQTIAVCSYKGNDLYTTRSGTSFAAPLTAGALALIKAQFPGETYRQTINRLLRSTTPLKTNPFTSHLSYVQTGGRLNLAQALASTSNRPFNDDFASRHYLSTNTFALARSCNTGATIEPEEPNPTNQPRTASLWYSWSARTSGTAVITTKNSTPDTLLSVYAGTTLSNLTHLASNDNASANTLTSEVTFAATANTTYLICVSSLNNTEGLISLNVGIPSPNKTPALAKIIAPNILQSHESNGLQHPDATKLPVKYPTETPSLATTPGTSVWYSYTPDTTRIISFSVTNAAFVPAISIYDLAANPTTALANGLYSIDIALTAGRSYTIGIDSTDTRTGPFTLNLVHNSSLSAYTGGKGMPSPLITSDNTLVLCTTSRLQTALTTNPTNVRIPGYMGLNTPCAGPDGTVYTTSASGHVFGIRFNNTQKWRRLLDQPIGAPPALAANGNLYVHTSDGSLHALDSANGETRWSANVPGDSPSAPAIAADGTIYIGSDDGYLYAINPDGTPKWRFQAGSAIATSPAIGSDNSVYFGANNGKFYHVSATGTQRYVYNSGNAILNSSPALDRTGAAYFGTDIDGIHAVNPDGTVKWTYSPIRTFIAYSSPAIAADGTVYIGTLGGTIEAISATGQPIKSYIAGREIVSSPLIRADGKLVYSSYDNFSYVIEIGQGPMDSAWPMHRGNPQRTGQAKTATTTPTPTPNPTPAPPTSGGGGGGGSPSAYFLTALATLVCVRAKHRAPHAG